MASVRYVILAACQNAGLYAQAGWESEAAAWIEKQGDRPCAYVGYRRGQGVAGFDNVSVVFGGSDPSAALRRVRDSLERSLEFRSERQTEVGGFPALVMTARSKRRVYGVFGGGVSPVPPTPPTPTGNPMYFEAVEANSTVSMMSMLENAPNLEYSTDGVTWQKWQHTTAEGVHTFDTITLGAVGDRIYLRGDNPNGLGYFSPNIGSPMYSNFILNGAIEADGNVMSLLDSTLQLTEVPMFGLVGLFGYMSEGFDTALVKTPSMETITYIGPGGCVNMYSNCVSLVSTTNMPLLTSIDFQGCVYMYYGCTSLASAADMPSLTNISENGCTGIYGGCTFNMSDDGTTLNFDFPTPPVTAGTNTYSTAYDVAEWMGNTNGFTNP